MVIAIWELEGARKDKGIFKGIKSYHLHCENPSNAVAKTDDTASYGKWIFKFNQET